MYIGAATVEICHVIQKSHSWHMSGQKCSSKRYMHPMFMGFPGGWDCKESVCNARDLGLTPGLGRSSGGGHGNPLQYSCLEHPGARLLCPWSRKELDTTERLSTAQDEETEVYRYFVTEKMHLKTPYWPVIQRKATCFQSYSQKQKRK